MNYIYKYFIKYGLALTEKLLKFIFKLAPNSYKYI